MSGGLEAIERLISETDQRFIEKLKQCRANAAPNLSVLADRTFNLRLQVAHNAALMGDAHFVEMLEDVETCLAPEYTLRGGTDRKLYAFLAGQLKGLLRETVGVQSFAARKVQIEMVWHWYLDKKDQILDYSLEKMNERPGSPRTDEADRNRDAAQKQQQQQTAESAPLSPDPTQHQHHHQHSGGRSAAAEAALAKQAALYAVPSAPRPATSAASTSGGGCKLRFAEEADRKTEQAAIAKQLALYRQRNLSKASQFREDVRAATAAGAAKSDAVRVVYRKKTEEQQRQEVVDRDTVRIHGSGPAPFRHVQHAVPPRFNPPSSLATSSSAAAAAAAPPPPPTTEETLAAAHQRVISHLVTRLEADHDAREMADAQAVLGFQQARMEEETARRIEASSVSAQAGRTCHTVLLRAPPVPGEAHVTLQSKMPSARLETSEVSTLLGIPTAPQAASEESISAYDHYRPNALDEQRLQDMLARLQSKDAEVSGARRAKGGFISPHPRSMAGTGAQPGALGLQAGPATAVTPACPRADIPFIEQLYPALAAEEDVPSAARLQQLRMVDRVRDCFARATTKGGGPIHVPRTVIERALLTPDDRPFEECMRLLPRPGSGFPRNPFPEAKEKKKGGKGKKAEKK